MPKPTSSALVSGLSLITLLLTPAGANAQSATAGAGAALFPAANTREQTCNDFVLASTAACSLTSFDGLMQATSSAYAAVAGPLGVQATVIANGYGVAGAEGGAGASASFTDLFTLSNVPPGGTVDFNVHLTGVATATGGCQVYGSQQSLPTTVGPNPCPHFLANILQVYLEYDYLNPAPPPRSHFIPDRLVNASNVAGPYDGLYGVTLPAVSGTVAIRLTMAANTFFYGSTGPLTGSASTDFLSTARLASIIFHDANGVDVSNQVGFLAASGATYQIGNPDATAVVPEPTTMVLTATGLVALLGRRRRESGGGAQEPSGP